MCVYSSTTSFPWGCWVILCFAGVLSNCKPVCFNCSTAIWIVDIVSKRFWFILCNICLSHPLWIYFHMVLPASRWKKIQLKWMKWSNKCDTHPQHMLSIYEWLIAWSFVNPDQALRGKKRTFSPPLCMDMWEK